MPYTQMTEYFSIRFGLETKGESGKHTTEFRLPLTGAGTSPVSLRDTDFLHIATYVSNKKLRYAAIFVKEPWPAWVAYHGYTPHRHRKRILLFTQGRLPLGCAISDGI